MQYNESSWNELCKHEPKQIFLMLNTHTHTQTQADNDDFNHHNQQNYSSTTTTKQEGILHLFGCFAG